LKEKTIEIVEDYKRCFGTPSGKKVLYDLMKRGHIMEARFTADPYATHFNEGMRHIVTQILTILGTDPKRMQSMLKKQREMEDTLHEHFN